MTEAKLEIADVSGLSAALASKQAAGALSTVQGIGGGQSLHDVGGGELRTLVFAVPCWAVSCVCHCGWM